MLKGEEKEEKKGKEKHGCVTAVKRAVSNSFVYLSPYTMGLYLWHLVIYNFCAFNILPHFHNTKLEFLYFIIPPLVAYTVIFLAYILWERPLRCASMRVFEWIRNAGKDRSPIPGENHPKPEAEPLEQKIHSYEDGGKMEMEQP